MLLPNLLFYTLLVAVVLTLPMVLKGVVIYIAESYKRLRRRLMRKF